MCAIHFFFTIICHMHGQQHAIFNQVKMWVALGSKYSERLQESITEGNTKAIAKIPYPDKHLATGCHALMHTEPCTYYMESISNNMY